MHCSAAASPSAMLQIAAGGTGRRTKTTDDMQQIPDGTETQFVLITRVSGVKRHNQSQPVNHNQLTKDTKALKNVTFLVNRLQRSVYNLSNTERYTINRFICLENKIHHQRLRRLPGRCIYARGLCANWKSKTSDNVTFGKSG